MSGASSASVKRESRQPGFSIESGTAKACAG